jgi:hypothetical protein
VRFAATLGALLACPLCAVAALPQGDSTGTAVAVRAERPARIDGKDDDAIWTIAPAHSAFFEFQPTEDKRARFRTEFRVAYDDHNLYVFVRAFDPHPDSIMHALSRHDVRGPADQLKIVVDAYHDRRTAFEFAVNPDGVKREFAMSNDTNEDASWNGVWEVATVVDAQGWTAEYRIPFSQLRFGDKPRHVFGFAIWRDIERFKERVSWPAYRPSRTGFVSQLGELTGITGIPSKHNVEFTPYAVAKNLSRTFPSRFDRVQQAAFGGDLKFGVTSNLTLDATVNPDFGQVEADPAVLNLSAFETFFPEKRPFFVEGAGVYQFGVNCNIVNCSGEGLFYSRRIGRSPALLGKYGDASSPTATPIAAAAKLTGRRARGLSLGVLDAMTPVVHGIGGETIEPETNFTLVRAQQDLNGGTSGFGFIGTGVHRSLDRWTNDALRRSAYVGGADFRHKFWGRQYEVSGSVTASRIEGRPATIAAAQRSAVHYYQQPDAGLAYDSTRTSLTGDAEELFFGKYGGGTIRFQTSYMRQSPGYEPNDLGFLQRADAQSWSTWGALQYRTPTRIYKSAQFNFNQWNRWSAGGLRLENAVNHNMHINFVNNWWFNGGVTAYQLGEVYCDRCTRGGPELRVSPGVAPWLGFNGDDRRPVIPYFYVNLGRGDEGRSWYVNVSPEIDTKVSTRLQTSLAVNWTHRVDDGQWYGNFTDAVKVTHYAFARLDQRTL